ncbi:MAG: TIR domain-containing protein [Clostridia bacterium]|nr:TIR domain-containing protein [Clostridia bacterium]
MSKKPDSLCVEEAPMATFECISCGGTLKLLQGRTTARCEYCGLVQPVPDPDNAEKSRLFRIANERLRHFEFTAAENRYRKIAGDDPEDSEAYWGMLLSSYGIQYVEDAATGRRLPTINRMSHNSVLEDENYLKACRYADPDQLRVYQTEGQIIEKIRTRFLEIINTQEDFQIFICYKETDEQNRRTEDSVIAQNVYDALTEKGYRVFFSRITLESLGGDEYEPIIYAALTTARVMLAFGTDYSHYRAQWVANEWERFLNLMKEDASRILIPCYKGMEHDELPPELENQPTFQDMGENGAVEELVRGVEKLLPLEITVDSMDPTLSNLFVRGEICMQGGQWNEAREVMEKVLSSDPAEAQAYLALAMIENRIKTREEFSEKYILGEIRDSNNLKRARQFAGQGLKVFLDEMDRGRDRMASAAENSGLVRSKIEFVDESGRQRTKILFTSDATAEKIASEYRERIRDASEADFRQIAASLNRLSDLEDRYSQLNQQRGCMDFMSFMEFDTGLYTIAALALFLGSVMSLVYARGETQWGMVGVLLAGIVQAYAVKEIWDTPQAIGSIVLSFGILFLSGTWEPGAWIAAGCALVFLFMIAAFRIQEEKQDRRSAAVKKQRRLEEDEIRALLLPHIERTLRELYLDAYGQRDPEMKEFDYKSESRSLCNGVLDGLKARSETMEQEGDLQ